VKIVATAVVIVLGAATPLMAQPPQPVERVTFSQAIERAMERNPSSAIAAAGILRADAMLSDTRSATRLQITGTVTTTTLNRGVKFEDTTVTPQNSVNGTVDVRMPFYAPAAWARRAQAEDQQNIAELSASETRRQTALATADAYLTIIARRRVVEANERALETARAHFDLARQLQERGTGSRLNQLRAQQELSTDEGLVESARFALYRAQEALGVLIVADGPVDAADEPDFSIPDSAIVGSGFSRTENGGFARTDLNLFDAEQRAAERVVRDSSKDVFPSLQAVFQPQTNYPAPFFAAGNSWRFLVQGTIPMFDSGQRASQRTLRQSALDVSRATFNRALTAATSEVRTSRESVASAERALASAEAGASQAQEVVTIVNVSFRAGAATNIEVIDAERRARDADTAVAVAEDTLRRARLDLLNALGRFP
jgi:outer membrane protein TolC